MKNIIHWIGKFALGTGISSRFPFLFQLYKMLARPTFQTIIVDIPLEKKLIVVDDFGMGLYFKLQGKYEPFQTSLFLKKIKKGDIFFDIGAYVGYYSVLAGAYVGKTGIVASFEPNPYSFTILKKNLKLNGLTNVRVFEYAVYEKKDSLNLYIAPEAEVQSSLFKSRKKSVNVKAINLDAFVKQESLIPNILKIDVEGGEDFVLKGAEKTLQLPNLKTVFLEIASSRSLSPDILLKNNFNLSIIDEREKKLYAFSKRLLAEKIKKYGFINLLAER